MRKTTELNLQNTVNNYSEYKKLHNSELALVKLIVDFEKTIEEAGNNYDPSIIATYSYELAKAYSKLFADCSIFQAESEEAKYFRVALSKTTGEVIKKAMNLLGIDVPERM